MVIIYTLWQMKKVFQIYCKISDCIEIGENTNTISFNSHTPHRHNEIHYTVDTRTPWLALAVVVVVCSLASFDLCAFRKYSVFPDNAIHFLRYFKRVLFYCLFLSKFSNCFLFFHMKFTHITNPFDIFSFPCICNYSGTHNTTTMATNSAVKLVGISIIFPAKNLLPFLCSAAKLVVCLSHLHTLLRTLSFSSR